MSAVEKKESLGSRIE